MIGRRPPASRGRRRLGGRRHHLRLSRRGRTGQPGVCGGGERGDTGRGRAAVARRCARFDASRGADAVAIARGMARQRGGRATGSIDVRIGSQRFAAREVRARQRPAGVGGAREIARGSAIDRIRRIERGLVVIGLVALAAAIAGSLWLSRDPDGSRLITPFAGLAIRAYGSLLVAADWIILAELVLVLN